MPETKKRAYTKRERIERRPLGLSLPNTSPLRGVVTLAYLRALTRSIPASLPDTHNVEFVDGEIRVTA